MVWSTFDISLTVVGTVLKVFGCFVLAFRFICLKLFDLTEDCIRNLRNDLDCSEEKEMLDAMTRANPIDVYFTDCTLLKRDWRKI